VHTELWKRFEGRHPPAVCFDPNIRCSQESLAFAQVLGDAAAATASIREYLSMLFVSGAGRLGRCSVGTSQPDEVEFYLGIASLVSPQIERRRGDLINQRHRQSQLRQIYALDVMLACLAGLHS
jgi:hypothetical protein